jgi:hypothetical protein
MTESTEKRFEKVHGRALRRFDDIQAICSPERKQCREDRRFYSITGAQWEDALGEQFENLPKFEVNKIHLSVIRIFNEYRNNRISVDFRAKDGATELADTLDGLYRADEQDSGAQEAYDNAFEEAVGGGFGAWRLRAKYEDDEDEDDDRQRICIEPIFDADTSVYFDLNAKRQDKADARWAFVITAFSHEAYTEAYGDDPASWPKTTWENFDWCTPDVVYVAEYYEIEETSQKLYWFRGLTGEEKKLTDEELEGQAEDLKALGYKMVRSKRVKRQRVHKYQLSGSRILEDEGYIAGKYIPIIPVYGKRWYVDNVERCMGHVRLAKDAQRLQNMQLSRLGQIAALSPIEKPIFAPSQVAGHTTMWAEDNVKNYPFLMANPLTDPVTGAMSTAPLGYTKPPSVPPALAALYEATQRDIQEVLGNQQAGEKLQSNVSADAVELVQNRVDMQAFIYTDNMAKAMKRCGEVWLSMAQDVYVEEKREMKAVDERGNASTVTLMAPGYDVQKKEETTENDISRAKMDVITDVGPSYATRRDSTVRALTGMLQVVAPVDPEDAKVLSSAILMNMDGEGISDIQDYYRAKLVRMGVVKPTDKEKQELAQEAANTKPDPLAELAAAQSEESRAKAQKAQADTMLAVANTQKVEAETVKTLADADSTRVNDVIRAVETIRQPVTQ